MPGPSGTRLRNPFPTLITFSLNTTISMWEVEVGLPGVEGGEPIRTTTMRNLVWETQDPRVLVKFEGATIKVAYDPQAILAIVAMCNKLQQITFTFPTGGSWTIWAWLRSFKPDPNTIDDKQPEASCMIEPSMHDNSGAEVNITVGTTTSSTSTTTTTS